MCALDSSPVIFQPIIFNLSLIMWVQPYSPPFALYVLAFCRERKAGCNMHMLRRTTQDYPSTTQQKRALYINCGRKKRGTSKYRHQGEIGNSKQQQISFKNRGRSRRVIIHSIKIVSNYAKALRTAAGAAFDCSAPGCWGSVVVPERSLA